MKIEISLFSTYQIKKLEKSKPNIYGTEIPVQYSARTEILVQYLARNSTYHKLNSSATKIYITF